MKLLCWGDSNTYGYDPRGFFGGRYDADSRWCDLLERDTGCTVLNGGENGRSTPIHTWEYQQVPDLLEREAPVDLLVLMLGTNDLLMGYQESPEEIAGHMEKLVDLVMEKAPDTGILVVGLPPIGLPAPGLARQLTMLNGLYRKLAEEKGVLFCPVDSWSLGLAYDGVHLTPEGHRTFARQMAQFLRENQLIK